MGKRGKSKRGGPSGRQSGDHVRPCKSADNSGSMSLKVGGSKRLAAVFKEKNCLPTREGSTGGYWGGHGGGEIERGGVWGGGDCLDALIARLAA